jgi:hypothetical protein
MFHDASPKQKSDRLSGISNPMFVFRQNGGDPLALNRLIPTFFRIFEIPSLECKILLALMDESGM